MIGLSWLWRINDVIQRDASYFYRETVDSGSSNRVRDRAKNFALGTFLIIARIYFRSAVIIYGAETSTPSASFTIRAYIPDRGAF